MLIEGMLAGLFKNAYSSIRRMSNLSKLMDRYVWIDLELTGLDPMKDDILEIACIITTPQLDIVHDGVHLVIHQSDVKLASMNAWSQKHHSETGLTEASRQSNISLDQADTLVSDYISDHTEPQGVKYIAGNSVYMDKLFIDVHMPKVSSLLHYRIVDVSTIKTLCGHWYPEEMEKFNKKKLIHRALEDIKESILELKNYRSAIFK